MEENKNNMTLNLGAKDNQNNKGKLGRPLLRAKSQSHLGYTEGAKIYIYTF